MTVTIKDVAHAAGVSKGAVSYALNGRPGVSDDTRARILKVAGELGWKPSLRAKGLSSAKAYAVGLVVARNPLLLGTDPFFPAFIAGIETTLVEHEYALVLTVAASDEAEEQAYRKLAAEGRVDGVILTDVRVDDSRIALLQELKIPAVTLNRPETPSPFPAVCMDDTNGITDVVTYLVSLGHTRIAHVGGPQTYIHGRSRRLAWQNALSKAGIEGGAFIESDFTAAGGLAATAVLLGSAQPPTAIIFANDLMATAGQSYAQSLGLAVPDDLSITGYDNTELATYLNPPLTTISADPLLWGRVAAQKLLDLLGGARSEDVFLPSPAIVVRASTGPAASVPGG
ncbi:LacI family DNA-binding transcriptional regulator [Arthrobacter sp. C9C5]|uniref:LacI family DNA-binding transcriptional regulator n=1 Tax=Arthrobacter sp. C9C5 TaxID=2735267 RepID=UPI001585A900|nr:LacI family DNA-binding transcriptional regulator [Arthrobacter sp. C9C5]NUU33407.1 LacI family DNA-binding transcriptional regulator [Arthrobacter sp. C9C5]